MNGAEKIAKIISDSKVDSLKLLKLVEAEQVAIILGLLESFTIRAGVLKPDETDFVVLKRIRDAINESLASENMIRAVDLFLPAASGIETTVKSMVLDANPNVKFKKDIIDISSDRAQIIGGLAKNLASPKSFRVNIEAPLTRIIKSAVDAEMSFNEAKTIISKYVKGDSKRGGLLSRYVTQISTDALNQWKGTVSARISTQYGLIDYIYSGATKTTSRPQCRRWLHSSWTDANGKNRRGYNGKLTREIIENEMKRASKSVGKSSIFFQGYSAYAYPTANNFPTIRGGHNCDDFATPTLFEPDEAQRAIDRYNAIEGTSIKQKYIGQRTTD